MLLQVRKTHCKILSLYKFVSDELKRYFDSYSIHRFESYRALAHGFGVTLLLAIYPYNNIDSDDNRVTSLRTTGSEVRVLPLLRQCSSAGRTRKFLC